MSRFAVEATPISGVSVLERKPLGDERGLFERLFCSDELRDLLEPGAAIAQINKTVTVRCGSVRGMHFQYPPFAETKLVTCLSGEVFDVAVDLRESSPTFLGWHGERLSGAGHTSLVIPRGCAHGFQTLTDDVVMLYFHTAAYAPGAEGTIHHRDPRVGIQWPAPVTEVSEKDERQPFLSDTFRGVQL